MRDDDINEWLRIYKENLNDETVSHEQLLREVNLILPRIILSKFVPSLHHVINTSSNFYSGDLLHKSCHPNGNSYLACKYEELQRMHGYENPINCENFPNK